MKKQLFTNVSKDTEILINKTLLSVKANSFAAQKARIKDESPYSDAINGSFSSYNEFVHLLSIGLKEAKVTRSALIRNIDPNLYITSEHKTNYELMIGGDSPYAADDSSELIELHHIGQDYNGPFAEITTSEHSAFGNSKLLHVSKEKSWRNDKTKVNSFQKEKNKYWEMRALRQFEATTTPVSKKRNFIESNTKMNVTQLDVLENINESIKQLFEECSISDLKYIAGLANSYVLIKQLGANSIEGYVRKIMDEHSLPIKCPHCASEKYSLYGYQDTALGEKQRYKCKECGSVYSLLNNAIISGCNMSLQEWINFIECLYNGYSTTKTAAICNISEKAAFDNRLRLFYALKVLGDKIVLSGNIAIDEKVKTLSYKGNRTLQKGFSMPRKTRHRGGENHTPGMSKNQVSIICAIDESGDSVARIAGLGGASAKKISRALNQCIDKKTLTSLYSDASSAIRNFANDNGYPIKQTTMGKGNKRKKRNVVKMVQKVNSYHERLDKFLDRFNGVSSELLSGYINLFAWHDRTRHNEPIDAYKELLSIMVTPGLGKSIKEIHEELLFESPDEIEKSFKTKDLSFKTTKRYAAIYERWSRGETMQRIGISYGISKQRISEIIKIYTELGYAKATEKDKKKNSEKAAMILHHEKLESKRKSQLERNQSMLAEKEHWSGSSEEFYKSMEEKYGIKKQTVKNRIAEAKNISKLQEKFSVADKAEYLTLDQVYQKIYARYNELAELYPNEKIATIYEMLRKEFEYKDSTLRGIVAKMNANPPKATELSKKKISTLQTRNRDVSVFIDYLLWEGSRNEFLEYAKDKYQLKPSTVNKIINRHHMADPKRFEITTKG